MGLHFATHNQNLLKSVEQIKEKMRWLLLGYLILVTHSLTHSRPLAPSPHPSG